jgi:hypothetical protein
MENSEQQPQPEAGEYDQDPAPKLWRRRPLRLRRGLLKPLRR